MSGFDLVVVGDANPDVVVRGAPRLLPYGQRERLVDSGDLVLGGSGAITACGAARLGLRTAFVGRVGADAAGDFALAAMARRGVDVRACVVDHEHPTALTVVLVDGVDRSILTAPGCLPFSSLDDLDHDLVATARHVHVSSYFLQPRLTATLPAWFAALREAGIGTSMDTNDDPSGAWDSAVRNSIAHTDVILPNEEEAIALVGCEPGDLAEACRRLATMSRLPVVKRGANGGWAWRDGRAVSVPGLPVEPVDTVGAGDSFNAGFIAGLLSGLGDVGALRLATACGSLSTLAAGGTAGQPTLGEAMAATAAMAP